MEQVILVDENDRQIGLMEKQAAHVTPHLHRAFSVFIFNSKGELLMQQRALSKYHSPGLWTNTCCSHPRDGETTLEAARRRLMEEMGMSCDIKEVYSFIYKAPVGQGLTEHEFDHVFIGQSDMSPNINFDEVASWKYMSICDISKDIVLYPEHYTEWFKITFEEMAQHAAIFQP
ncbi:MAG: isopentenyl-diphosphate Delta-isomerase [Bacteroidales bacterium]|nr:isopentenyl-diphosphate Delta-isomerase [Bacteroidales bacterium]MBR0538724.1 isopentenyl-diphosphate Delta-isomerase [Bacteroidales bacterium]